MSVIYIASPEGQQASHSEEEAQRLWDEGAIAQGSFCWREGMTEWRPAQEYFGSAPMPAAIPAPPPLPAREATRRFVKDPTSLTKMLLGLLWAYLAAAVVAGLVSLAMIVTGQTAILDPENFTTADVATMMVRFPQFIVTIATGVIFLMWIHRANVNARGFGARGMEFTPGWAVGYYFIPILNLWKPYRAMKEIWQASKNPSSWASQRAPSLLSLWWGLWLASCMLGNASLRSSLRADSSQELVISEIITVVSDVVDVPLCLVAMRMVREIVRMQRECAEQGARSVCAVCQQTVLEAETIILDGVQVCARCKPEMVQRMKEGLGQR